MIFLFLQCVSTVIIVYIIISPLNSYLYIHWILDLIFSSEPGMVDDLEVREEFEEGNEH